jgi:hypothetical protein
LIADAGANVTNGRAEHTNGAAPQSLPNGGWEATACAAHRPGRHSVTQSMPQHPLARVLPAPTSATTERLRTSGFGLLGLWFSFTPIIGIIAWPMVLLGLVFAWIGLSRVRSGRAASGA